MKRKNFTLYVSRAGMIAAIYVVLTLLSSFMGLSSGAIQLRLSEALCLFPLIFPEAIAGLTIGCALANLITGSVFWDIIFGTLATLIGALGTYAMRGLPSKFDFIKTFPTVIANAVIVPFVLMWAYGIDDGYFLLMLSVGIGEFVCATILGAALYRTVKRVL